MDQFQPTLFDKLMMGAAEFLIPFWMPLVIGSLIAIFAKTLLKQKGDDTKSFTFNVGTQF